MAYLGISCGGDWEVPVFFILYWDGKKVRGYVPTNGNPYNTDTNRAYGNDADADVKNFKKRYQISVSKEDEIDTDADDDLIREDIAARILPAPAAPPKAKKGDLAARVKAIRYYGTGDEGEELFQATCALAYQMNGLGDSERAAILVSWAEDMGRESKVWAKKEGRLNDFVSGYWSR